MNSGDQTFMWILIGGVTAFVLMYLTKPAPVQSAYVPPYIPYGAITGSPCPPGGTSGFGGQPCACPPGAAC